LGSSHYFVVGQTPEDKCKELSADFTFLLVFAVPKLLENADALAGWESVLGCLAIVLGAPSCVRVRNEE
jgi:hypothetical protein